MDEAFNPNPPLPPLALSRWRNVPNLLSGVGLGLAILGVVLDPDQFGYSYLLAFMFFLSLGLGALFLVMMHHLFDAGWSVPLRRFCEHLACLLFPWMAIFFIPILLLAKRLYPWMTLDPAGDHALRAKLPLLTMPGFYLASAACFAVWWLLSSKLRFWSLQQDQTGAALCTRRMRFHSCWGIAAFAVTLTLSSIMWVKALMHEWYSTMYGVYYFAESVWVTLAAVFLIMMVLNRQRILSQVLQTHQYYFLGSMFFAFTVFYAYIHFSQYFIIWNANLPEEAFWYTIREQGTWFWVGMVLIFGHFLLPFLALLRIDVKCVFWTMFPLSLWAVLMHYFDMSFNIMPLKWPHGFPIQWAWLDLGCLAFIGGVLTMVFLRDLHRHPVYPLKDPRLHEALGIVLPGAGREPNALDENLPSGISHEGGRR